MGLLDILNGLDTSADDGSRDKITPAPFGYPGGKSRSVKQILPLLPYRGAYVEVFGGSGIVLINRRPSRLDVFNDKYSGVVAFYRCLRDEKMYARLLELLDQRLYSREEFLLAKYTWENQEDPVERAANWYYMIRASFGGLGRNWGRSVSSGTNCANKFFSGFEGLWEVHKRFQNVQVENLDWRRCLADYDRDDTVFYLDPPYVDSSPAHKHVMTVDDHRELLDTVFHLKGFVAISGYSNPLYENQDWSSRHEWDSYVSIESTGAANKDNSKDGLDGNRQSAKEVLWVRE